MSEVRSPRPRRYKAFVSYCHADSRDARGIHQFLESYVVPARLVGQATSAGAIPSRLRPIFRDRDELPSSSDLGALVNAALADAENLIVVCSPQAARSRWVNEEVLTYKRLGRADRILCFASPDDVAGRATLARALINSGRPADALAVLDDASVDLDVPEALSLWLRASIRENGAAAIREQLTVLAGTGYRHPDLVADLEALGVAY